YAVAKAIVNVGRTNTNGGMGRGECSPTLSVSPGCPVALCRVGRRVGRQQECAGIDLEPRAQFDDLSLARLLSFAAEQLRSGPLAAEQPAQPLSRKGVISLRGRSARAKIVVMTKLAEIELAARHLPPEEKQRLLVLVAQSLREEGYPLPEPRLFSPDQMQAWMDEDERDLRIFRGQG
ncbi:MAG: hypothetical protein ACREJM_15885, partial [Candidatus Saccharimonadales bacterium]